MATHSTVYVVNLLYCTVHTIEVYALYINASILSWGRSRSQIFVTTVFKNVYAFNNSFLD